MKQARQSLDKKEYIQARYLFLKAYRAFAAQKQFTEAVECGVKASALYHREKLYTEAFDLLRDIQQTVVTNKAKEPKAMNELLYPVTKERLQIQTNVKNTVRAKEQLTRLEEIDKAAANDSLHKDLLYTKANYYYTFGMPAQGDAAIRQLIEQYKAGKAYDKISECYKTLINTARSAGNASLVARSYEQYIVWSDSIKVLKAKDELLQLKQQYDESLVTLQEKENSLTQKQYIIISLCVLAALLAGVLVIGGIILIRFILLSRTQKRHIQTISEHNEQKTGFIRNISVQMEPTLATLDDTQPGVQALRTFTTHIQELSELESSLSEGYEMQEKEVSIFCNQLIEQVRDSVNEGVTLTVNAPRLSVRISPEPLAHILRHLLENAATHTPAGGKIWIDFKKRGAHTQQFIVSDTGCGIPEEQREKLFQPFTEIKNLAEGDGLGLPICALMAMKMNGSLTLDTSYTKGARFILELHT